MIKSFLANILLILFTITTIAQSNPDSSGSKVDSVYTNVEIEASFPGGTQAWIKYLQKNLDAAIPSDKGAKNGMYRVIVKFIVSKDGYISDIEPITSYGYGMEEEVVRIIKNSPNWTPAIYQGRQVNAYRQQPVTFQIIDESRPKRKKNL